MWQRVCEAIGAPELFERPEFASNALRSKNRDAVNAEIEKHTIGKTSAEWIDIFNKIGVPSGPIYAIDQVFADPQVKHLGIAQDGVKPDGKKQTFVGQPVSLSRTPSKIASTPPEQGQHTDEVLKEFGFAESEIAELHKAKVV
jgi:formyl-CoA transferase